jgi:prophage regulatory protein
MELKQLVNIGDRLLKIKDIVRDEKRGVPGIVPVGKSTWWDGVRRGIYPQPVKIGGGTFWRQSDIVRFITTLS